MSLLSFFRRSRSSASVAKDRLSIIVARGNAGARGRDYLAQLKEELLRVIAKYEQVDARQIHVNLERDGDCEVMELSIVLTEGAPPPASRTGSPVPTSA
jgi:cell division topological specificity factor